jgi:ABC-type Fe3+-hydroxamate transport system substrate-binding protein
MPVRKSGTVTAAAAAAAATPAACVMLGIGYNVWKKQKERSTTPTTTFRIVSLNPSTTQTFYDLGLADFVVGRTRYCSRPPPPPDEDGIVNDSSSCCKNDNNKQTTTTKRVVHVIRKVGGTKDVDWDKVGALEPTHILFNMEENVCTELPIAQSICHTNFHTPVNIEESRESVLLLGQMFHAMLLLSH